jgi:hypothetical protein
MVILLASKPDWLALMRPRQRRIYSRAPRSIVMAGLGPGLGPAIHVFVAAQDMDARVKPAHDVASIKPM